MSSSFKSVLKTLKTWFAHCLPSLTHVAGCQLEWFLYERINLLCFLGKNLYFGILQLHYINDMISVFNWSDYNRYLFFFNFVCSEFIKYRETASFHFYTDDDCEARDKTESVDGVRSYLLYLINKFSHFFFKCSNTGFIFFESTFLLGEFSCAGDWVFWNINVFNLDFGSSALANRHQIIDMLFRQRRKLIINS